MSLTIGAGPLAPNPAPGNYAIEGPAHRILFEPVGRRVRLELAGETVLDTTGAMLLHETAIRPRLYVPLADARAELLRPSETTSHCPFKGDASYRSVQVGDLIAVDALWVYDEPLAAAAWLGGFAGVYEERFDRLLDEDEPVLGHLPDPYHRLDVRAGSRPVRVTGPDGELLAETQRPLVLAETGRPRRLLVPRADVTAPLVPGEQEGSVDPYTGRTSSWTVAGVPDAVVAFDDPPDDLLRIADHVAFDGDGDDDGIDVREFD
jgi:uncharacterized protein (DUF427 family)